MMHGYGIMHGFGTGAGFGIVGIIFMLVQLLFWGALIYLIFAAIKRIGSKEKHNDNVDNSLKILKERYARGEIDEEEYKKRKEILKN